MVREFELLKGDDTDKRELRCCALVMVIVLMMVVVVVNVAVVALTAAVVVVEVVVVVRPLATAKAFHVDYVTLARSTRGISRGRRLTQRANASVNGQRIDYFQLTAFSSQRCPCSLVRLLIPARSATWCKDSEPARRASRVAARRKSSRRSARPASLTANVVLRQRCSTPAWW